jgi:3-hydroxybutyryl-CoA dehydrogenase
MTGRAAGRGFYDYAVESPRDARARVTAPAGTKDEDVRIGVIGPDAAELREHAAVKARLDDNAAVVVFRSHGRPTTASVDELRAAMERAAVVVDSSDAGWADVLPPGAGWVRLHAWRDEVFAEVVDDETAGIQVTDAVHALIDALGAPSVRVLALPGLVADRLAYCLANEAYAVVEEGTAKPDDVNTALRLAMNHPVGPLEYVDRVGIATVHTGLRSMLDEFGDPRYRPTQLMRRQVGALARKP